MSTAVLVSAAALAAGPAAAATAPVTNARILVHFDVSLGQTPENIALAPAGRLYLTLALARGVARIDSSGAVRIIATLPAPPPGTTALTTGIVRAQDGTLYVAYAAGTSALSGVWRIRPGADPARIAGLPGDSFPNGMALDRRTGMLYIADSLLGAVWRVPLAGGPAANWAAGPALAPRSFFGANGLKVRDGAVWVSNTDQGTLLRIPIHADGQPGTPQTMASGLPGIDDFTFLGRDSVLAALNAGNAVALIHPDGSHAIVLTSADGLENPAAVAIRGDTILVADAAYTTQHDPNLLTAHLDARDPS
jgi:sugar lactone lactonase YvrE